MMSRMVSLAWFSSLLANLVPGRHEAFFKAKVSHSVPNPKGKAFSFVEGELIKIEESFKVVSNSFSTAFVFIFPIVL
jgi:hypothetical protein